MFLMKFSQIHKLSKNVRFNLTQTVGSLVGCDFCAMVTTLSALQNLTFEDIHAVRTYEKA